MTWAEFKKAIEDAGVKGEMEVDYIDISYPSESWKPLVGFSDDKDSFSVT